MKNNQINLDALDRQSKLHLIDLLSELDNRLKYNKLEQVFPDYGTYARHLYPKSLEFFKAGANFKERCLFGGNRTGKSTTNYTEVAYHLTKEYPDWWEGKKFYDGIVVWCAGDSNTNIRDIAQYQLLGPMNDIGTGLIPKDRIVMESIKVKPGVPNAIDSFAVRDDLGQLNWCTFKSYEQGRKAFQGTAVHVVSLDEEPPMDVYQEALTRTMTTKGIMMLSFTPLSGMTDVVLSFLPDGQFPEEHNIPNTSKWVVQLTWDDVPHLSKTEKEAKLSSCPVYLRDAVSKGIPSIGAGKIFTTLEDDFVVKPFEIPYSWPRFYALDIGYGTTACVWMAYNYDSDIFYIYDELYMKEALPESIAAAIKRRGPWIRGVIDPSSMRSNDRDGRKAKLIYDNLGLNTVTADNAIEAGLTEMRVRLSTDGLKVMDHCQNFLKEYRLYRYGNDGKPARNQADHCMDASRYGLMSGRRVMMSLKDKDDDERDDGNLYREFKDMNRNGTTGY